ncbi:MAG: glycosyltransferase family 2 protein [Candidatus Cryptobacteroides sp.]
MCSDPKISVIVPCYNAESTVRRCVDSILAQTFTDFECLLIDDGSKDRSGEICDDFAAKDSRVRVFHKENGGVSSARNLGLDNARGEWVAFVDSDDWVQDDFLESLHSEAISTGSDVVTCDLVEVKETGALSFDSFDWSGEHPIDIATIDKSDLIDSVDEYSWGIVVTSLFSKALIERHSLRFNTRYKYCEDTQFLIVALVRSERCGHLKRPLYYYDRRNESSATNNITADYYFNRFSHICEVYRLLEKTGLLPRNRDNIYRRIIGNAWPLVFSPASYPELQEGLMIIPPGFLLTCPPFSLDQRVALWLIRGKHFYLLSRIAPKFKRTAAKYK